MWAKISPTSTCTRSLSTSFCSLVSATLGWPWLSSTITSTLRPAIVPPFSSSHIEIPLVMSLPICAAPPVMAVITPILIGPFGAGAGDHEAEILVQPHVIAKRAHARLALANPDKRLPERRPHDRAEHDQGQQESSEGEVVERDPARERPRQPEVGARDAGDAVVALGHRDPPMREPPDDHAERQGDHEEVDAARAQREEPEDRSDRGRQEHADRQRDPER